jgi:pyruvate dehydrogenase E2 component (dihydrolipoamide acetyltransferase)
VVQDGGLPALLIWGSDDAIIPVSHSAGLKAQVEVLPGQAHMVQMEAAEQVNRLILDFVQQH